MPPKLITETLDDTPFHVQLPGPGTEPSLIADFAGLVGITDIVGIAVSGPSDPTGLTYDADMRFMSGVLWVVQTVTFTSARSALFELMSSSGSRLQRVLQSDPRLQFRY